MQGQVCGHICALKTKMFTTMILFQICDVVRVVQVPQAFSRSVKQHAHLSAGQCQLVVITPAFFSGRRQLVTLQSLVA